MVYFNPNVLSDSASGGLQQSSPLSIPYRIAFRCTASNQACTTYMADTIPVTLSTITVTHTHTLLYYIHHKKVLNKNEHKPAKAPLSSSSSLIWLYEERRLLWYSESLLVSHAKTTIATTTRLRTPPHVVLGVAVASLKQRSPRSLIS